MRSVSRERRLLSIFCELIDLPEASRLERLAQFEAGIAEELRSMLREHEAAGGLLEDADARALGLDEDLEGSVLCGFRLQRLVGIGGSGRVYRAEDPSGAGPVAVKVVPLEVVERRGRARVEGVLQRVARVRHPGVARVQSWHVDTARGLFCYSMEWIDGVSLLEGMRSKGSSICASPHDVAKLGREVAAGLAALHAAGCVHRDVSPGNIMLRADPDRSAVLIDIGLETASQSRFDSTLHLTWGYAAPETIVGRDAGARSDLYSLGVVLYDCLAGERIERKRPGELPLLSSLRTDVDGRFAAILRMATQVSPRWRHAHARALVEDLEAWQDGRRPCHALPPLWRRVPRWIVRHPERVLRGTALVFLVTLAAAGGLFLFAHGRGYFAARAALDRADLVQFVAHERGLPRPLVRMLAPDSENGSLQDVLVALRTGDLQAACRRAARADDQNAVDCERFLLAALRGRDAVLRMHALDALARRELENPCVTAAELRSKRELREAAAELMGMPLEPRRLHAVFAVLAACGDAESLRRLVQALARVVKHERPESAELVRHGIACVQGIVSRAGNCGLPASCLTPDDAELLAVLERIVARVAPETTRWLNAERALRDASLEVHLELRARNLESQTRRESTSKLLAVASGALSPERVFARPEAYADEIEAVALASSLRPDPERDRAIEQRILQKLEGPRYRRTVAASFRYWLGETRRLVSRGEPSHLFAALRPPTVEAYTTRHDPRDFLRSYEAAAVDCRQEPIVLHRNAVSFQLRAATPLRGEAGGRSILLHRAGQSELSLAFVPRAEHPIVAVEIEVQKELRRLRAGGGGAALDLVLDGRVVTEGIPIHSFGVQHVRVPLDLPTTSPSSRLTLRLNERSTTSLRVMSVIVGGRFDHGPLPVRRK